MDIVIWTSLCDANRSLAHSRLWDSHAFKKKKEKKKKKKKKLKIE